MVRVSDSDLTELMKKICREPAPDYHNALFIWNERNAVSEALKGDKLAARTVAGRISRMLGGYNEEIETGRRYYLQPPDYIRDYLIDALAKIERGQDANEAFHLTKPGPAKWSEFNKLYAVDLVSRLIARSGGLTQRRACDFVASFLADSANGRGTSYAPPCTDDLFCLNPISGDVLVQWYIALRGRIATAMHNTNLNNGVSIYH